MLNAAHKTAGMEYFGDVIASQAVAGMDVFLLHLINIYGMEFACETSHSQIPSQEEG